ncbi:MAG: selenide, water dikinase SelD [Bacteroidota bacterium]
MNLTEYSRASGCGCKIAPADLQEILQDCGFDHSNPLLLVGSGSNDDAAVYDLGNDRALIFTTDFFMPMVNDPFEFGKIAAANALSDVYAMGGKPFLALAILGWPIEQLPKSVASEVMKGAEFVCKEANVTIGGGHSVNSKEPFFGLAVNGMVEKSNIKKNNILTEGLQLGLTKPLGFGIGTSMLRRGLLDDVEILELQNWMSKLNGHGHELGELHAVKSMTDITGFGILGHALEMATSFDGSIFLNYNSIPILDLARRGASQFVFPDNTTKNFNFVKEDCTALSGEQMLTLCDPQTSGGLLFSYEKQSKNEIEKILGADGLSWHVIGETRAYSEKKLHVY